MSAAREILVRYLRQRCELGENELFLERLTGERLHQLLTERAEPASLVNASPLREDAERWGGERSRDSGAPTAMVGGETAPREPRAEHLATETLLAVADLNELRGLALGCPRCRLCETRSHVVFGQGAARADLMIVVEAPGVDDDRSGQVLTGSAGRLLDLFLAAVGFSRESIYICNVVMCRPPGDRDPEPEEVEACNPFLRRQLEMVGPRAILTLGGFAANTLLGSATPVGRLRGTAHEFEGIPLVPSYHPDALLRNPVLVRSVWEDFQRLRSILDSR